MFHQDIVIYEILKLFPKARLIEGGKVSDAVVDGIMFWSNREKMKHHLVMIDFDNLAHIVHLYRDTIFVLVGTQPPKLAPQGNAIVALGDHASTGQVFNKLIDMFEMLRTWKGNLSKAENEFFSYEAIVRSCDALLSAPLALMDNEFRYVAYSKALAAETGYDDLFVDENGYLPLEYINAATSNPGYGAFLQRTDVYRMSDLENGLHKNVFSEGSFIGRLTLPASRDDLENAFSAQVLRIVGAHVESLHAKLGTFYRFRSNDTRFRKMLEGLLGGQRVELDELTSLLENRGYRKGDRYHLVQFRANIHEATSRIGESLGSYLSASWPGCFGFTFDGKTLVLVNDTFFERSSRRDFEREMAVFLRESLLVAGLSREFTQILDIRAALAQTDIALSCGQLLDPMQWFPKFEEYAFWHLVHNGSQDFLPHQICDQAINVLRAHDEAHGTDLDATLRAFIRNRYNAVATAKALNVSRSAFLKRMCRIEELTALNLDDYKRRLYLALSYEILDQG